MKALTLILTIGVLAVSACQSSSSPVGLPSDEGRSLQPADGGGCDPQAVPC